MRFYHWVKFPKQPRVRHVAWGVARGEIHVTRSDKTACGRSDFLVGATGDEPMCFRCRQWIEGVADVMEHRQ